ncbi:MAG: helix-turn-helix domain-containing protein [Chloroflexi bacterium]|nr:helix-turn-helix domain-containing protein [Chloroflexota bacterium]
MSGIIRVKKDGRYFVASAEPFNDERLSWEARGVMAYLLSKPDGWECRNEDLQLRGPAGRDKVARIVNELKQTGYIRRYQRRNDDGRFTTVTEVYESPRLNPDITAYGFSVYGKTVNGSTANGKPVSIVNTDQINIDRGEGEQPQFVYGSSDENLEIAWGMLVHLCDDDMAEAALVWQLQRRFSEVTAVKIPDLASVGGREELEREWWPFLRRVLSQAEGDLETAVQGITQAQQEMDSAALTLASPKSVVKKAVGVIGRMKRANGMKALEQPVKGNGASGEHPKGWETLAQRRAQLLQKQESP